MLDISAQQQHHPCLHMSTARLFRIDGQPDWNRIWMGIPQNRSTLHIQFSQWLVTPRRNPIWSKISISQNPPFYLFIEKFRPKLGNDGLGEEFSWEVSQGETSMCVVLQSYWNGFRALNTQPFWLRPSPYEPASFSPPTSTVTSMIDTRTD